VLGRDVLARLDTAIIGPGDFDNFYYAWSLWEFRRALLSGRLPGFTHDVYGQSASVPIFVEGLLDHLLAVPLQSFLTPLGAYDAVVLLGFVLAALAMHLLASAFTPSWTACVVAGIVFSFSTYHLARALGHLGLATLEVLPFCAWTLVVLWRRPSPRTAVLAGVGIGLVPWAAVNYLAYFLVPLGLVALAAGLLLEWRWFGRARNLALLVLAVAVGLAVAAPSLVDYVLLKPDELAAIEAQTSRWELRIYSLDLVALFVPDPANPLVGPRFAQLYPSLPGVPERSAFLGVPALLFAAMALALLWRRRAVLAWLAAAAAGAALALGPWLRVGGRLLAPLPFHDLVYRWPPLDDFAAPNRAAVLTLVAVSVLAAIGAGAVLSRLPARRGWRATGGMAALCLTGAGLAPSLLFGGGLTALPARVPALYPVMAAMPDDGLVMDVPAVAGSQQFFQTIGHKRLAAGVVPRLPDPAALQLENVPYYSLLTEGWRPPDSDTAPDAASADIYPLRPFAAGLREHGIAYVVLHRLSCIEPAALWPCSELPYYADARRFLANTLGAPFYDGATDGLTAWHVGDPPPVATGAPAYRLGDGWLPYLGRLNDGEPRRMMGPRASVVVQAGAADEARLLVRASSYVRPMTLEVRFDGRTLRAAALSVGAPADLDLGPVRLQPGANVLDLRSLDGCVVPDDLDPRYYGPNLDGIGYRCVSFAVERIALNEGSAVP
jgi:hypothetical protein